MLTREDVVQIAETKLLADNPWLAAELASMVDDDDLLMTANEMRQAHYGDIVSQAARLKGVHPWEYQLLIVEGLGYDVSHIRAEDRRQTAELLGID